MFRFVAFLVSGFVSFLLVSTVVARQLDATTLQVRPVADRQLKMNAPHRLTGTVKEVDLAAKTFSIKTRRGDQHFVISTETQLKKGREKMRMDGLRPDSKVTVIYRDRNGKKVAGIIRLSK
jgi:hypothetical protein